ncbi:hypothetical protein P1P75_05565 [Streptomyces sp. ID05-39B]|uniref:hypothetical protein n=1 Tax=Streptomyces sp. ID05-39B TaxID=3028664 RepID=UPI0029B0F3FF|nr:hypothetical protein [Streptomyces sp. ID05-39B]MDX3525914.1 hypothetical protein [Streptomyces sp. ID05-39B]
MSIVSRRLRVGGAFGHLLLIVVLAFGVLAMHTMGHPEHTSGRGTDALMHAVVGTHQGGMSVGAADTRTSAEPAEITDHVTVASAAPSVDEPMISMDVLSVCVAVLTGWLLWLFLCAAARRKEQLTELLARVMAVLRPSPPPPRPLLAQLSVLRI